MPVGSAPICGVLLLLGSVPVGSACLLVIMCGKLNAQWLHVRKCGAPHVPVQQKYRCCEVPPSPPRSLPSCPAPTADKHAYTCTCTYIHSYRHKHMFARARSGCLASNFVQGHETRTERISSSLLATPLPSSPSVAAAAASAMAAAVANNSSSSLTSGSSWPFSVVCKASPNLAGN